MVKRSILDEKPTRVPIAGKIRAGIKVLTRAAAQNPEAAALYEAGMKDGKAYDAIEKTIAEKCKIAYPLTPRNTPFFRVNRRDFTVPEVADRIVALYAEDRGAGPQVYRFPVVFAFDDWLDNMPNGLRAFTKAGLKYWSEYDAAGERFCMERVPVKMDERSKRAPRLFGGRASKLRDDHEGRCMPEQCPQYQKRECTLSGRILFYVPGVPGSSLVELDTTSIYSLRQIRSQMELVSGLRQGRISGTHNGAPIFMLSKVEELVSRINDEGQPEKTKQFLVKLDSNLQMVDMITSGERAMTALPAPTVDATLPACDCINECGDDPAVARGEAKCAKPQNPGRGKPHTETPPADTQADHVKGMRRTIATILAENGKDAETFGIDMAMKHGTDWSRNTTKLSQVLADLESGVFA